MKRIEAAKLGLDKRNTFGENINKTALAMTKILGEEIPVEMSLTIANYTMATFTGHFHLKMRISFDNIVPCNIITFVLAKSGAKKTSSMLKLEKVLKGGYSVIDEYRYNKAVQEAEELELDKIRKPAPLSNSLATEAGMIQRLNDFAHEGLGCPSMYVDEISTELASNPDMIPNIKLISQLFDTGDMKSKPLKDRAAQSEEVHGMGMTALFIGSEHGILEDDSVLKKFVTEFISKLARRSFFVYPEFTDDDGDVDGEDELLREIEEQEEESAEIEQEISEDARLMAKNMIEQDQMVIDVDDDTMKMYRLYKIYCEELSKDIADEAASLEQNHRHWKALKLAGVYAVFNGHFLIEEQDLREAIYIAELNGGDLSKFNYMANRQKYEILVDHYLNGGQELSAHDIVKKGWAKSTGTPLRQLVELGNSKLGSDGMFTLTDDNIIEYKSFQKSEGIGASWLRVTGSKDERSGKTAVGYKYKRSTFEKLGNLMASDCAFSPFEFKDGVRGTEHIISGADFIVLDVDKDGVTDTEASDMLCDFTNIIARTSDASNPYKFRIMLKTDITLDIEHDKWKPFLKKVAAYIGIDVDLLPKAQISYGYKGRELLTNEGLDFPASEMIKNLEAPEPKAKKLGNKALADVMDNSFETFKYAYEIRSGEGLHNSLWKVSVHAHDLGFSYDDTVAILEDILDYLDDEPRKGYMDGLYKRMLGYKGWKK